MAAIRATVCLTTDKGTASCEYREECGRYVITLRDEAHDICDVVDSSDFMTAFILFMQKAADAIGRVSPDAVESAQTDRARRRSFIASGMN